MMTKRDMYVYIAVGKKSEKKKATTKKHKIDQTPESTSFVDGDSTVSGHRS